MRKILIFLITFSLSLNLLSFPVLASGGEETEEVQTEEAQPQEDTQSQEQVSQAQPSKEEAPGKEAVPEEAVVLEEKDVNPLEKKGTDASNVSKASTEPVKEAQIDDSMGITAPSAVLMEASTGTVVLEKNSHQKLPPASVTKIMTLLLIFDALSQGKIKLEDMVTTSAYAASMGGSQVYLEEGEAQSVDTMIKCISVSSANDASVAYRHSRQAKILVICTLLG